MPPAVSIKDICGDTITVTADTWYIVLTSKEDGARPVRIELDVAGRDQLVKALTDWTPTE